MGAYDLLAQPFYEPEVRRILYNACSRPVPGARPVAGSVLNRHFETDNGLHETMSSDNRRLRQQQPRPSARRAEGIHPHSEHQHAARAHAADIQRAAEFVADEPANRRAWRTSRSSRRQAIRWCTPTGCTRRASRRCSATATTTSSRRIRWNCGITPPFEPTERNGNLYAPRRGRRQGPDVHARQGHRGAARGATARCRST